jgi:hypothetical protein
MQIAPVVLSQGLVKTMELVLDVVSVVSGTKATHLAPLRAGGKRAIVLFFIAHECPISNGYAPEINRICALYTPKSFDFFVIYAEPNVPIATQRAHTKAFGYVCSTLRDPDLILAERVNATVTPEVVVLSPQEKTLYQGRIDNTYAALGKRRFAATEHDLRDALEAILRKKPVRNPQTRAIGCAIAR